MQVPWFAAGCGHLVGQFVIEIPLAHHGRFQAFSETDQTADFRAVAVSVLTLDGNHDQSLRTGEQHLSSCDCARVHDGCLTARSLHSCYDCF